MLKKADADEYAEFLKGKLQEVEKEKVRVLFLFARVKVLSPCVHTFSARHNSHVLHTAENSDDGSSQCVPRKFQTGKSNR